MRSHVCFTPLRVHQSVKDVYARQSDGAHSRPDCKRILWLVPCLLLTSHSHLAQIVQAIHYPVLLGPDDSVECYIAMLIVELTVDASALALQSR